MHKGYKCLDRSTGRIFISQDVVFDENLYPFAAAVPVPTSSPSLFPLSEPVLYDDCVRNLQSYSVGT
jgi:hypothetical protein